MNIDPVTAVRDAAGSLLFRMPYSPVKRGGLVACKGQIEHSSKGHRGLVILNHTLADYPV